MILLWFEIVYFRVIDEWGLTFMFWPVEGLQIKNIRSLLWDTCCRQINPSVVPTKLKPCMCDKLWRGLIFNHCSLSTKHLDIVKKDFDHQKSGPILQATRRRWRRNFDSWLCSLTKSLFIMLLYQFFDMSLIWKIYAGSINIKILIIIYEERPQLLSKSISIFLVHTNGT